MNIPALQEKHSSIASIILKNGEKYPKKHGEWIRYNLIGNIYLVMDSWNKAIWVMKNAEYNNFCTGFSGKHLAYLGIDFGGYEGRVSEKVLNNILEQCNRNLGITTP